MDRVLTYKVVENGYDIYASVGGSEPAVALHQPEPFIICRILNEDGTTDYAKSAEAHIALLEQEAAEVEKQKEEEKAQAEKVAALESSIADLENAICELSMMLS
jgi:hypothetical protein